MRENKTNYMEYDEAPRLAIGYALFIEIKTHCR